jgi:hypothetical protein
MQSAFGGFLMGRGTILTGREGVLISAVRSRTWLDEGEASMAFEVEKVCSYAERRARSDQPILTEREWRGDICGTAENTAGQTADLDSMASLVENCFSAGCSWRRRDDGKTLCQGPWACA